MNPGPETCSGKVLPFYYVNPLLISKSWKFDKTKSFEKTLFFVKTKNFEKEFIFSGFSLKMQFLLLE
jgi:hypothetical protein